MSSLQEESNRCTEYFNEIADNTAACRKLVESITSRIENGDLDMKHGNNFLNARNQLMVAYLTNLSRLFQIKSSGLKLEGNPVVDRLVDLRVYIEKSQKIYKKMSYQIEKILSLGKNVTDKQNNPLAFKPAPHNLLDLDEDEEDEEDYDSNDEQNQVSSSLGSKKKTGKSKVYVPPKVAAMMYDDDESAELSKQKAIEKAKKRALSSNIIQDLRREYDEGPEEISTGSIRKKKMEKKLNEIKEYEEDNFIRVTMSKKEKAKLKQPLTSGRNLGDEITQFGDTSFLTAGTSGVNLTQKTKSKSKPKNKSIKKKRGKRKFRK